MQTVNSSARATAIEETRERKKNRWLGVINGIVDIFLILHIAAILVVILPLTWFGYMYRKACTVTPVNPPEEGRKTQDCHDYARRYA